MTSESLLDCPFCGSGELSVGYQEPPHQGVVQCHSCDAAMIRDSEAEAIAAWNRRPTPIPAGLEEAVERAERAERETAELREHVSGLSDVLTKVAEHVTTMRRETVTALEQGEAVSRDCIPLFTSVGLVNDGEGWDFAPTEPAAPSHRTAGEWRARREEVAQAWVAGFLNGVRRQPWDDMHDWAALTARDYATVALREASHEQG